MKKFFLTLFALMAISVFTAMAQDGEDTYRYEIEDFTGGVAPEGRVLVKVWNYGKKETITRQLCMRNAVHGVIFKGVSGSSRTGLNKGHTALVPDGYNSHKDYFDNFFGNGDYLQFVEVTNNGNIQPGDRIKISRKEYKIGMVCSINYNALRQRLEKDGISKGLNFLF